MARTMWQEIRPSRQNGLFAVTHIRFKLWNPVERCWRENKDVEPYPIYLNDAWVGSPERLGEVIEGMLETSREKIIGAIMLNRKYGEYDKEYMLEKLELISWGELRRKYPTLADRLKDEWKGSTIIWEG